MELECTLPYSQESANDLTLSLMNPVNFHAYFFKRIFQVVSFPYGFPTKTSYAILMFLVLAMCSAHLTFLLSPQHYLAKNINYAIPHYVKCCAYELQKRNSEIQDKIK
jgi:hypothetical protein